MMTCRELVELPSTSSRTNAAGASASSSIMTPGRRASPTGDYRSPSGDAPGLPAVDCTALLTRLLAGKGGGRIGASDREDAVDFPLPQRSRLRRWALPVPLQRQQVLLIEAERLGRSNRPQTPCPAQIAEHGSVFSISPDASRVPHPEDARLPLASACPMMARAASSHLPVVSGDRQKGPFRIPGRQAVDPRAVFMARTSRVVLNPPPRCRRVPVRVLGQSADEMSRTSGRPPIAGCGGRFRPTMLGPCRAATSLRFITMNSPALAKAAWRPAFSPRQQLSSVLELAGRTPSTRAVSA